MSRSCVQACPVSMRVCVHMRACVRARVCVRVVLVLLWADLRDRSSVIRCGFASKALGGDLWGVGAGGAGSYLILSLVCRGPGQFLFLNPHLTLERPLPHALCLKEQAAWAEGRAEWGPEVTRSLPCPRPQLLLPPIVCLWSPVASPGGQTPNYCLSELPVTSKAMFSKQSLW